MKEVFKGMTNTTWAIIVADCFLGLCVACVLKLADAMVKQLASGWLAPLEPLVGHFVVGTPVTPLMVLSTILAGAGSIVYRLEPASESNDKKSSQTPSDTCDGVGPTITTSSFYQTWDT